MTYALEIRDLYKRYDGKGAEPKEALRRVSMTVPRGSIFGLLGPNGAGKSTMINIIAGLVTKTSGKVIVMGDDQDEAPRKTRYHLGIVPQEVVLDPFFDVYNTLEIYAGYYGVPKRERRTQEIIDALGLTDKSAVNSRRLSGGMKRRVLIAKALVHNPKILILDEPTAGVDVELRTRLWEYVRKLNDDGVTIILTTHYLEEADELCDEIAVINHGRIIARDTTRNLKKMIDKKELHIFTVGDMEHPPTLPEGYAARMCGNRHMVVTYSPTAGDINEILASVKGQGAEIRDITTKEPDLEDSFRHLVGKQDAI